MKKFFSTIILLLITGFSFFYTDKIVKIAREVDPIMIKINNAKKYIKVSNISPIIKKDEYVAGISGCSIDEEKSYNKMKQIGKFDEDLLVMKEESNNISRKNKYIVNGNTKERNISLILNVNEKLNSNIINYFNTKKIKINFFIDGYFLENNLSYVKTLSNYGNIYNLGRNKSYDEKYIIYDNNLIESMSKNKSNYCLVNKKDKNTLKLCNEYGMEVIKPKIINNKNKLDVNLKNGSILVMDINDSTDLKLKINYIISKGFELKKLNDLLDESVNCN